MTPPDFSFGRPHALVCARPSSVVDAVRNAVPFLALTVRWTVIMLAVYGVFLVTKPDGITSRPLVHASVFAVPAVGFLGHVLQQAIAGGRA